MCIIAAIHVAKFLACHGCTGLPMRYGAASAAASAAGQQCGRKSTGQLYVAVVTIANFSFSEDVLQQ